MLTQKDEKCKNMFVCMGIVDYKKLTINDLEIGLVIVLFSMLQIMYTCGIINFIKISIKNLIEIFRRKTRCYNIK